MDLNLMDQVPTALRQDNAQSLFERALGASYAELPPLLRDLHRLGTQKDFRGIASVEVGDTVIARLVSLLFRFLGATGSVSLHVMVKERSDGETWTRNFAGKRFRSHLSFAGKPGQLKERFGIFSFDVGLKADKAGIEMRVLGWHIGAIRLPNFLRPSSTATEAVDESGQFCFDVPIDLPLGLGRVVHYKGVLKTPPKQCTNFRWC